MAAQCVSKSDQVFHGQRSGEAQRVSRDTTWRWPSCRGEQSSPREVPTLPPYQRCTAAKDGQLQGGLVQQKNAVECVDCRKTKESTCCINMMMKINEGQKGVEGNYHPSRLLMPSVSAPSPKCCLHLQQQVLRCAATQLKTSHRSCSTRQTYSAYKHWHDKRRAQHAQRPYRCHTGIF